ncbi:MAG: GntR family transcriptional regulator [Clostridiales bacterium]|nr:GntR family transcriptional regulator [Clostridiales bacterium]
MNYEKWAFHDISPISQQLIQKLKYAILSNELSCGEGIPSVREMAEWLHINPNTVLKSYKVLKQEQLIICSTGRKYFVTQDRAYVQQIKQDTINELCCSYLSQMFALGFNKQEAIEKLQIYCDKLNCHK